MKVIGIKVKGKRGISAAMETQGSKLKAVSEGRRARDDGRRKAGGGDQSSDFRPLISDH